MRLRYKIGLVVSILGAVFLLGRCSRPTSTRPPKPPTVLPPADSEQILVNPARHQLTIVTGTGTRTMTLPDRESVIDVLKDGGVKITSPQYGWERHMFVGVVGADHFRIGAGMDGLYWKRLDLGIGIADQVGEYTPVVFAKLTYNIKGNLQVGIAYQTNRYVGGTLAVRMF